MVRASVTAAVLAVMTVLNSASAAAQPVTSAIAGTSWRFVEVMGVSPPEFVQPTLQLSVDGAATGDTGCNQFFGGYVSAGLELSFVDLGYTKMMCAPAVMTVEMTVQDALARTSRMSTARDELDLIDSDGTVLARLTAVT